MIASVYVVASPDIRPLEDGGGTAGTLLLLIPSPIRVPLWASIVAVMVVGGGWVAIAQLRAWARKQVLLLIDANGVTTQSIFEQTPRHLRWDEIASYEKKKYTVVFSYGASGKSLAVPLQGIKNPEGVWLAIQREQPNLRSFDFGRKY